MIVLDASATLPILLEDEANDQIDRFFVDVEDNFVAPAIWKYELCNSLLQARRSGRISGENLEAHFDLVSELGIEVDEDVPSHRLIKLAMKYELTAYDAAYLELAIRKGAELATLDQKLSAAAKKAGVRLAI